MSEASLSTGDLILIAGWLIIWAISLLIAHIYTEKLWESMLFQEQQESENRQTLIMRIGSEYSWGVAIKFIVFTMGFSFVIAEVLMKKATRGLGGHFEISLLGISMTGYMVVLISILLLLFFLETIMHDIHNMRVQ
jgi:hypothetical protein